MTQTCAECPALLLVSDCASVGMCGGRIVIIRLLTENLYDGCDFFYVVDLASLSVPCGAKTDSSLNTARS